jgi:two-component system, cell cycle sensor histidine kinase and response regulator CckA
MEAVGRLAGGVAHDFNNLLTVISGEARILLGEDLPPDLRESLEAIVEAGDRGSGLTQQLLAFSRRQVVQPVPLDLNDVIGRLDRMLARLLGEKVEMRTRLAEALDPVVADFGEMEQVLMNLAVNARDAMPDGGVMEVATGTFELTWEDRGRHPGLDPGRYVVLSVRDEGTGIDPAHASRIFEPFFTTKPVGKGTGLGLSTVYGIVHRAGGKVEVESLPGAGTTFRIFLPVADAEAEAAGTGRKPRMSAHMAGEGTIAVVEDEEAVRRMAFRILERGGYRVLTFEGPTAALRHLKDPDVRVHLLLTDVRMPEMDGDELADRLREVRPELLVLYMSGYPEESGVDDRSLDRRTGFLAKPFTPDQLLERVRTLLTVNAPAGRGR